NSNRNRLAIPYGWKNPATGTTKTRYPEDEQYRNRRINFTIEGLRKGRMTADSIALYSMD
ncbi:hypothetical protein J0J30_23875, partial [Vibrio vulnificus]|nr:hypothetical protein [Vibrio vulnificus]